MEIGLDRRIDSTQSRGYCTVFLSGVINSMTTSSRCSVVLHLTTLFTFSASSTELCVTDNSGVRCGDGNHVRLTRLPGYEVSPMSTYTRTTSYMVRILCLTIRQVERNKIYIDCAFILTAY